MKDPIVICILHPSPLKTSTTEVNVAVGIIKSACDEDQHSEAKSQSESKTFSRIKKANHCQLWLDLYIIPSQGGWERGLNVKIENKN